MLGPNKNITVRSKVKISEDAYGEASYAEVVESFDALVAWGTTGLDYGVERNVMTTQGTVYVPKNKSVPLGAEIVIDGKHWRQAGEAVIWETPLSFSLEVGQVVPIEKVEG